MSATLTFFKEHPQAMDETHKLLAKIPELQAQLPPIRQAMLGCCGASQGKAGKIELTVADPGRWDTLAAQETAITSKMQAIDHMRETLDGIFAEIEAEGIDCPTKTLNGICYAEGAFRTPMIDPDTRTNYDRFGRKIPARQDARFLAWMQRAESAMRGL